VIAGGVAVVVMDLLGVSSQLVVHRCGWPGGRREPRGGVQRRRSEATRPGRRIGLIRRTARATYRRSVVTDRAGATAGREQSVQQPEEGADRGHARQLSDDDPHRDAEEQADDGPDRHRRRAWLTELRVIPHQVTVTGVTPRWVRLAPRARRPGRWCRRRSPAIRGNRKAAVQRLRPRRRPRMHWRILGSCRCR
jgi:hypothetical protein